MKKHQKSNFVTIPTSTQKNKTWKGIHFPQYIEKCSTIDHNLGTRLSFVIGQSTKGQNSTFYQFIPPQLKFKPLNIYSFEHEQNLKRPKDEFHLRQTMEVNKCFVGIFGNISSKLVNTSIPQYSSAHRRSSRTHTRCCLEH